MRRRRDFAFFLRPLAGRFACRPAVAAGVVVRPPRRVAPGLCALVAAALCLAPLPAAAQTGAPATGGGQAAPGQGAVRSPILTIDTDRLFAETLFGQRVQRDLNAAREALAAENMRIAAELTTEESDLARRRPEMEAEAFRAEAEAFDMKVQRIRAEQDAKELALAQSLAEGREAFLGAVSPVLGALMRESGAAVILDRRSVFLGVAAVDITDEAIAALDAEVGEGEGLLPRSQDGKAILDVPPPVAPGGAESAVPPLGPGDLPETAPDALPEAMPSPGADPAPSDVPPAQSGG